MAPYHLMVKDVLHLKLFMFMKKYKEKFLNQFCKKIDDLKLGLPWENTLLTPLPEPHKPKYIIDLIEDAKKKERKF